MEFIHPGKPRTDAAEECPVCVHALPSHVALTLDGLTICSECPGSDQCHRTAVESFGAAQLHLPIGNNFAAGQPAIDDLEFCK